MLIKNPQLGGIAMREFNGLDRIDQLILRSLSLHRDLSTLQLWYELVGDAAGAQWITEEAILGRVEALTARGLVELVRQTEGGARWALRKGRVFDAALVLA
jgi:hypothetical protein